MKVHNDEASLFEYVHAHISYPRRGGVLERLQSWTEKDHKSGHCRLVYKVRIHIPEGPFEEEADEQEEPESGAHRLLYIEAVHRVVAGLYSVTPAQAAVLASLQVQAYSGDSAAEEIGTQYIEDIGVQTLVAQAIIDKVGSADMIDAIAEEHATHQGLNQMEAERQYLQRVKLYCKCYGGLFFAAKEMHQDTGNAIARTLPRDVISSIADDGIHIMSGWNLTNHVFFKYEDITKWTTATDPDLFAFSVNDDMIYFLISDYPRYIEDAVQMYVSSVINRQQGAPLPTRRDSKLKLTKEEIYGPESTVNWEENICKSSCVGGG